MFSRLYEDPSPEFKQKVNNWLGKWPEKITKEWKKFITPNNSSAEKIYGMVKTHKKGSPVRLNAFFNAIVVVVFCYYYYYYFVLFYN